MTNDNITTIVLAGGKSSRMGRDKALLPIDGIPLLQKVCEVAMALCDRVYVVTPWQERYQHLLPCGCEFIREVVSRRGGFVEDTCQTTASSADKPARTPSVSRRGGFVEDTCQTTASSADKPARTPSVSRRGGFVEDTCQTTASSADKPARTPSVSRRGGFVEDTCQTTASSADKPAPTPVVQLPTTNSPLIGFAQGLIHVETEWVLLLACDLPCLRLEVLQAWTSELEEIPHEAIALLPRHPKGWEPLCGFYRRSCLNALETYIEQGGRSFQQWLAQYPVRALTDFEPPMLFNCNTPADYADVSRVD